MQRSIRKIHFLFMLVAIFCNQNLVAQDTLSKSPASSKWRFKAEPYFLFPNMSGQTGIAALPLMDVDANPSDIFDRLQMGGMLYLEVSNDKWSINSDLLFMNVKQDITPTRLINGGSIRAKQLGWELAGLRRVAPWLEFGIGGLLNSLEIDASVTRREIIGGGEITQTAKRSKTWLDPMLITRMTLPSKGKFMGQIRAEIGGFGIGSDLAMQGQILAGYRFSKLFDMSAGYRVISLDYISGEGASTFIYDMTTFGPMLRFGFNF